MESITNPHHHLETPPFFLCPVTLQIMKDPVTTITGITYDRYSIQKWISKSTNNPLCPVTNQPISSDLIPNHTLKRLIHVWLINACNSVDHYYPLLIDNSLGLDKDWIFKLMRVLENAVVENEDFVEGLMRMVEVVGSGGELGRVLMAECDVPKLMLELIVRCSKKSLSECVDRCLVVLNGVWSCYRPTDGFKMFVEGNFVNLVHHLLYAVTSSSARNNYLLALKRVIELSSINNLQLLNKDFFSKMVMLISGKMSTNTIHVLQIIVHLCSSVQSRTNIMEAGTIQALIELQLCNPQTNKTTTDLVFNVLSILCNYVEGRGRFLSHPCGLALLAERLLRVSPVVDEQILEMILLISKLSGRKEVVMEMLQVGVVSKLCMVMQADCADYLKAKARKVLRMHWNSWNGSPCISLYLLTMHHR